MSSLSCPQLDFKQLFRDAGGDIMLSAVVPLCIRPVEPNLDKYAGSFDSELPESNDGIVMCVT